MPRFFVDQSQISEEIVTITGDNAHHISRSLRMAAGEHITVCDMQGTDYDCVLQDFLTDRVTARIVSAVKTKNEPPYRVHLYQALPKGEKFDLIIQKAVECGVYDITPFESEFCIARVKTESEMKKNERRQRIALEAAMQSGRGIVPRVHTAVPFSQMLEDASKADIPLFCYEGTGTSSLKQLIRSRVLTSAGQDNRIPEISVVIGSEGGFSGTEAERAREAGMSMANLGSRILRTETASGLVLSCLIYELEL